MKLRARDAVSEEEEAILRSAVRTIKPVGSDFTLVRAGEDQTNSHVLLDGLMCRYKDLRDGSRQITELHVAGDFVDLHSFPLKHLDHNVMTLTPCQIAVVPHERLTAITETAPHLTRLLWFSTTLDAAIHREWELSLGIRTAIERVAHVFCELQARLSIVGLAEEKGFDLKLTQGELAECLGLTSIHVNRTLKELWLADLVTFKAGRVTVQNRPGLQRVAQFDPAYLYLEKRPH